MELGYVRRAGSICRLLRADSIRYEVVQFMLRICELNVTRSTRAATIISFSKSCVHWENSRFVVMMTLALSERSEIT